MSGKIGEAFGLVFLGGFLQWSLALPMKRMPCGRWEDMWLVYSAAGMVMLPWIMVFGTVPDLGRLLGAAPRCTIVEVALFGSGWGVGSRLAVM